LDSRFHGNDKENVMAKPHLKLRLSSPGMPAIGAAADAPLARAPLGDGAYVAGSRSHPDLRRWTPQLGSADSDLLPERELIVARARNLENNHGVADGGRQTYHDNIVGCGLRLSAKPNWRVLGWDRDQAEEWGNTVEAWWSTFWETTMVDAAENLTGDGLTSQAFNSTFLNGELLALPLWLPDRGYRFATALHLIDPDRLSNPNGEPNTERLRGGVEINGYGKPLRYWIRNTHPGERFFSFIRGLGFSGPSQWTGVPAFTPHGRARVIHAFDRQRSPQSRGKPALTSGMRQFKVLGDLTNAELKAAVVNAMVAMFTESALDQDGIVELLSSNPEALATYQAGLAERNSSAVEFTGGRIIPLRLGEKLSSFRSERPNTSFESFVTMLFRHIATGLHIPYELLMKDFSKTNYSSARAALLEAWRFFRGRRKWLSTYWMGPIYRLWLEEAVNMGLIEAPGFYENWEAYCRATWIGDGRGWVDPKKEAEAAQLRMSLNISTLEDECAEQGADWEERLTQRARELKFQATLEDEYGIKFTAPAPAAGNGPGNAADNDANEEWNGEERRGEQQPDAGEREPATTTANA
jgi:lambda family phage portal protein